MLYLFYIYYNNAAIEYTNCLLFTFHFCMYFVFAITRTISIKLSYKLVTIIKSIYIIYNLYNINLVL